MPHTDEPSALEPQVLEVLREVSTATLTMVLFKRGIANAALVGVDRVAGPVRRIVGEAFTVRFVPARGDLATPQSYASPGALRDAIESCPPGAIMMIDGRQSELAGTLGDILIGRLHARGVAGAISDAPVRDIAEVRKVGLPVFASGVCAPPSISGLSYAGFGDLIGCGGVAVAPGDIIVADDDGAVVIPRAMAAEVAAAGAEQERFERYVQLRVRGGATVFGLYPPDDAAVADYERWLDAGEPEAWPSP